MSDNRVQNNRPRIYDNDMFASDVAAAIYGRAARLWTDVDAYIDQLFAMTATADGYPYWAKALGIPLTYTQIQGRRDGICQWLLRGGTFNAEYLDSLIYKHTGSSVYEITEAVNWIDIYLPPNVSAASRYQLATALFEEKPLHVGFSILVLQSL